MRIGKLEWDGIRINWTWNCNAMDDIMDGLLHVSSCFW